MKKTITLIIFMLSTIFGYSQIIALDTVGSTCKIAEVSFAKNSLTYSLSGDSSISIYVIGNSKTWVNAHYSRFRNPSGGSFANRNALTLFLDNNFFAEAAASDSSGGGSAGNLQQTTDAGNSTSNAIQVTGADNISLDQSSLSILKPAEVGYLYNFNGGALTSGIEFDPSEEIGLTLYPNGQTNNLGFTIFKTDSGSDRIAEFSGRVKTANAQESDDVPTWGQVQTARINTVNLTQSNNGQTLPGSSYIIYTGSADGSFLLPDEAASSGMLIRLINDSPNNVVLTPASGGNKISDGGVKQSSTNINTGQARIIFCNGIYWYLVT